MKACSIVAVITGVDECLCASTLGADTDDTVQQYAVTFEPGAC